MFDGSRTVGRIDLDDIICTFTFVSQDLKCFRSIAGSNHAIRYFTVDDSGSRFVTDIGKGDKVSV